MLRRHLLTMLPLAALPLAVLPLSAAAACGAETGLAGMIGDSAAARRLGRAYLRVAGERCPLAIDAALWQRLAAHRDSSPDAIRQAVHQAISEDFAASRTVLVDGWLLAETECRLCALTALAA